MEPLEERCLLTASAAEAVNQFAMDVYEHLQQEEGNLFFSPLSLSAALSMTYAGAAGQTAAEMEQVLSVDPSIHASFGELFESFAEREDVTSAPGYWDWSTFPPVYVEGGYDTFRLDAANAIWPQSGMTVYEDFVHTIETDYDGQVQGVDYASDAEGAEDIINAWVKDQTEGLIEDLVSDLSADTRMVLTNTVYFNSLWDSPFDPRHTELRDFYRSADDEIGVPTMHSWVFNYFTSIQGFDVIDLSMGEGNASMLIVVPSQQNGPNHMSSEVVAGIEEWIAGGERYVPDMGLFLPKFQATVDTTFNELLTGMGMPSAFGPADFSAMTDQPLFIDKVFQKATIEVTEQGTEAAAATEVELSLCFAAGTPVLTPEGEKPIEELVAGDVVLSRNEQNLEGEVEPKIVEQTKHGLANIVELHANGRVIRTTEAHPFFVEERGWTAAGKVQVGDRLATNQGDWVMVDKVVQTSKAEAVYNLRVADHHTYFVGSKSWGFAVWTHNYYDFYVNQPFHFLIRDNVTSTIAFMGRINDPTDLTNSLNPSVSGDYNSDGLVDDADHGLWRSSYGQTGPDLEADGNRDGVVNAADYTIWRDNLTTLPAPAASASESSPTPARAEAQSGPSKADIPFYLAPNVHFDKPVADLVPVAASLDSQVAEDDLLLLAGTMWSPGAVEAVTDLFSFRDKQDDAAVDDLFGQLGDEEGALDPELGLSL